MVLSLEVVPVLSDARQPRSCKKHAASFRECLQVLRAPAMFHATFLRFWQGAADATSLTFAPYYLSFVCEQDSNSRSKWLFIAGAFVAPMDIALTFLWILLWGSRESQGRHSRISKVGRSASSMRTVCLGLHLAAVIACPLVLRLLPQVSAQVRPWEFVVYFLVLRLCYSPQTFY